ncbi:DUF2304 domain-containing protein [Rothia amarae]|uniref:DUF2304 domain-containing protein n=1 Tax=Rothia amarae TaxID=169480 RepID=A0A7H2BJY6_9MICC|nr:DUF2304 domain-containing protein [Rothia amarae]QNV39982.1 DUF2304 domain-containing protein [Rothia amarae]SIK60827.1 Uncharacterized conserved protein [Mycobacteroides abscessus subsp. abscessus]
MVANLFFLILTIILVVMVLVQVRNQKMKEKYAALWLIISFIIIILVIFPKLLDWLADAVGIETPVNLLFLLAIIMLIGVALHLTQALSKMGEDTRILAEKTAINDLLVEQLTNRVRQLENKEQQRP